MRRKLAIPVRLEPVGKKNKSEVLSLKLADDQADFVASNAESIKEAAGDRDARPRAVVADNRVVGFLMYDASEKEAVIYRFMIDQAEQGQGYGRAALAAALEEITAHSHVRKVVVCYMPENEGARQLYRSAGFIEKGEDEDGEILARLSIPKNRSKL
jgi:diamine N-acetyltransferase